MMKGLKRLAGGGMLLLELRGMRREIARLAAAQERVAAGLEAWLAHQYPQKVQADPDKPAVEVSYVDREEQALLMDCELGLTKALGRLPTEDEVVEEFERRRAAQG